MKNICLGYCFIIVGLMSSSCSNTTNLAPEFKVVFVTGDEEYRSEESMPMLAKILKRELNAEVKVCYSLDSAGFINPNRLDHISNLQELENADLMVMFTRFRALPDNELDYILKYVESGKPIVGFRTSTHAFLYKEDSAKIYLNTEWPKKIFGQQWITHHGHFDDGKKPLTRVFRTPNQFHPILKGVEDFPAYSWLYHVEGGGWSLGGDSKPFLFGLALQSNYKDQVEKYPLSNPVAWTKTYKGNSGKKARVFFTTLGHPYDFMDENMRKLALNGMYWALEISDRIPENGVHVEIKGKYEPSNSGFGNKFKNGVKPAKI